MAMRMLDKTIQPTIDQIQIHMGEVAYANLKDLENQLQLRYDLQKELKFPFGNTYGWGYKYSHKKIHLCYAFFENHQYTVMLQLGDTCAKEVEELIPSLSHQLQALWADRYPCGERGGWIHVPVKNPQDLEEVLQLIELKKHRKK